MNDDAVSRLNAQAAQRGEPAIVRVLARECGCDVDARDEEGDSDRREARG